MNKNNKFLGRVFCPKKCDYLRIFADSKILNTFETLFLQMTFAESNREAKLLDIQN